MSSPIDAENAVLIAVKLSEIRDSVRRILGDRYPGAVRRWRAVVRSVAQAQGKGVLEAGVGLVRTLDAAGLVPEQEMVLIAAVVEEMEAQG